MNPTDNPSSANACASNGPAGEITVVLPTYNEAENLELLIPELLKLPLRICIVDDNSPDGTGEIADAWARREPRVSVVHRPAKLGLGSAYLAGFRSSLEAGAQAILTMDSDFSHHPDYIPGMMEALRRADVVIGSRYVPGGEVRYPLHRRFLSKAANLVARKGLGLRTKDCTAGFRLYRSGVLNAIPLDRIVSNGYSFLVELLSMVEAQGFRVAEVPIIFEDRRLGETKISWAEVLRGVATVARLWVHPVGRR